MKLIINISEDFYKTIQKNSFQIQADGDVLYNAVLNATPLDDIVTDIKHCKNRNYGCNNVDFVAGLRSAFSQSLDIIDMHTI